MRAYTILKDQTKIHWQVSYSNKKENFRLLSVPMYIPFDNKAFNTAKALEAYYTELALRNEAVFIIVKNKFEENIL